MMSQVNNKQHGSIYESIMRGLHEAVELEKQCGSSGKVCYVCYEENSPALADDICTLDDRGWISALSVMETIESAVKWVQSRISEGQEHGYQLSDWCAAMALDQVTERLKTEGKLRIVMVDKDEDHSKKWFDIVIMARQLNKEYAV